MNDAKKIYLIQPTWYDRPGRLLKGEQTVFQSLALPAVGGATPADWEKEYCIEFFDPINFESDASVIGISLMGLDLERGIEVAREFRNRGKRVLIGGQQAEYSREQLQKVCDSIIIGNPGPKDMASILTDMMADNHKPVYRCGPSANYRFDYAAIEGKRIRFLPVLMGFGCREQCGFCRPAVYYQGRYRLRPVEILRDEFRELRKKGSLICFMDLNIHNNPEYLRRVCTMMRQERFGFVWGGQATPDIGDDPALLATLRAAGCRFLMIGLESPRQEDLVWLGKGCTAASYQKQIQQIHDAGIAVLGLFMFGLDDETETTYRSVLKFIQDSRIAFPGLNILIPAPGTPVHDRLRDEGRLMFQSEETLWKDPRIFSGNASSRCAHRPLRMSPASVESEFLELYSRLASWREILRRSLRWNPVMSAVLFSLNLGFRAQYRSLVRSEGATINCNKGAE